MEQDNELHINRDSIFYGIILSTFESGLLYHYDDQKISIYKALDTIRQDGSKGIDKLIDFYSNSFFVRIAELKQDIRDCELIEQAEHPVNDGTVPNNSLKKVNFESLVDKYECLIRDLIFYREVVKSTTKNTGNHLLWKGNHEQLNKLFRGLISNEEPLIDTKTSYSDFEGVFSFDLNKGTPIQWKGSNRLFAYLFNQMYAAHYIEKDWQSAIEKNKLFKNKSGKYFNANDLASALSEIRDVNPGSYEIVDKILKALRL